MRVRVVFVVCLLALTSAVGAQSGLIEPVTDVQVTGASPVVLSDLRVELNRAVATGGIDVPALLQRRGRDIAEFVTAHDLRFTSDVLAYTAIVAERPATSSTDAAVLVLLSLVPQEVASALADRGLPPVWLPLLVEFPRGGNGRSADVSFLASDRIVTIDMVNAAVVESSAALAASGDGCLDCLIDRVKQFSKDLWCEAVATTISCATGIGCPGVVLAQVIKAILKEAAIGQTCQAFSIAGCASKCLIHSVSGSPANGARVLADSIVPLTVTASSSGANIGAVWVLAYPNGSIGAPYVNVDPSVLPRSSLKSTFNNWRPSQGTWSVFYGTLPHIVQASFGIPKVTKATVTAEVPTYSISGSVGRSGVTVTAGSRSATSSSNGTYTITGLPAATYTVRPSRTGCTFSPSSRSVKVSGNTTGVSFTPSCK